MAVMVFEEILSTGRVAESAIAGRKKKMARHNAEGVKLAACKMRLDAVAGTRGALDL